MKKTLLLFLTCTMVTSLSIAAFASTNKVNPNMDDVGQEIEVSKEAIEYSPRAARNEAEPNNIRSQAEPNNLRTQADAMNIGDTMRGFINNASDIDCFKFSSSNTQTVTITMNGPSSYDYDLWLQDNTGAQLASSSNSGSNESLSYDVYPGQNYYIVANSYNGYSTSTPYNISLVGGNSSGSSGSLGITRYTQEKSNWCWATAVQMTSKYETGYKPSQSSIVTFIHGSPVNATGRMSDQVAALKNIDASAFANADYWSAKTIGEFDRWVVGNFNQRNSTSLACKIGTGIGHSFVVDEIDGDMVTLIDPWQNNQNIVLDKYEMVNQGFYSSTLSGTVYAEACVIY